MTGPRPAPEALTVNGRAVTAAALAEARQQLAHEGALLPAWDELTNDERADAAAVAASWLRALSRIVPPTRDVEVADLRADLDESDRLRERLAGILAGVANALKGPPKPMRMHDWSDLPAVAASVARMALQPVRPIADGWVVLANVPARPGVLVAQWHDTADGAVADAAEWLAPDAQAYALLPVTPPPRPAAPSCNACQCCPSRACDPGEPLGPGVCGDGCPCHDNPNG